MNKALEKDLRHILAVEDEPDHLLAVEMIFRNEPGYVFHGVGDTAAAQATLEQTPIDLIILDLALPGEDGIHFARRMKTMERYRDIPIIAFSAFPRQIYAERAFEAGCVDYIDKPFHPRELVDLVRKYTTVKE